MRRDGLRSEWTSRESGASSRLAFEWMEPDSSPGLRWKDLQSTAGWSILQHQRFYTRTFSVPSSSSPILIYAFSLTAGAEFSLRRIDSNSSATWYHGNMYSYKDSPPHFVKLGSGVDYALTVTYHHDIRIAGDIAAVGDDGVPRSKWKLEAERVEERPVVEPRRSIVPGVLRGRFMGKVVGVEVRNRARTTVQVVSVKCSNIAVCSFRQT